MAWARGRREAAAPTFVRKLTIRANAWRCSSSSALFPHRGMNSIHATKYRRLYTFCHRRITVFIAFRRCRACPLSIVYPDQRLNVPFNKRRVSC